MIPTIRYQRLQASDFPALQRLFKEVFGKEHRIEYLVQKYDSSYLDFPIVAHIAYDQGRPVGFAGALPMPFRRGNARFVGIQFCDYMTLPSHQRMGIHTRLMNLNLEAAKQNGADFAFAMHSHASSTGDSKIGWKSISAMQVFLHGGQLGIWKKLLRKLSGKTAQAGQKFKDLTKPWHLPSYVGLNSAPANSLQVDYSEAFLHSRQQGGSFALQMSSFRAWLKADRHLIIGDLYILNPATFLDDWDALCILANHAGLASVVIQFQENSQEAAIFATQMEWQPGHFPHWIPLKPDFDASDLWLNAGDFDTF